MITVLFNPAAGIERADGLPAELADLFRAARLPARIVSLGSPPDAAAAIGAATAAVVVAAGGDGTVSAVASALVGTSTPLGILPLGTRNHFAKDLGIPLDLEQAVQTIAAARTISVDVGEVNGRIFVNNSSIGVYPDIVVEREALRRQGHWKWTAFAMATARILRHYRGMAVRIDRGDSIEISRTPFLVVGNNEYQVDGIGLGARERLDGGRLFAYLAPRIRAHQLPRLMALALMGRAKTTGTLESFGAAELQVGILHRRRLRVALDGEVTVMLTPLRYRVRPRALAVLVPAA